jgi:hypothetical protein
MDFSLMYVWHVDVVQRAVIFHDRPKGCSDKRIHTKLIATYGPDANPLDSVKYWVRESDGG